MSGGDVAALIAAGAFVVLVGFLAFVLVKAARVLDEVKVTVRDLTDSVAPLLEETTQTVIETNKQLAKVDTITTQVQNVTSGISRITGAVTGIVGAPLTRVAAFVGAFRPGKKKSKR